MSTTTETLDTIKQAQQNAALARDLLGKSFTQASGLVFIASGNCDTDLDPTTLPPPPPMPPYDEAIFAIGTDGTPAWYWQPYAVDNADLDFGAVPNLFTIDVDGTPRDVIGVGQKNGTYYVIDRDGVNAVTGVRWDDADPSALPYWRTNVVPGGGEGGIIATAAVDEAARRIYFSTAPGDDLAHPQRPTVHALDADSGAIAWENTAEPNADASYAPTSAIPGVVFVGKVLGGALRTYDAATGALLGKVTVGFTLASAPAVMDGTAILGAGTGERSDDPSDPSDIASRAPQNVTALCAPGTTGCDPAPNDDCGEGGSAPADAQARVVIRSAVDAACPCASFDGSAGKNHADYDRCVHRVLGAAVAAGTLRRQCRSRSQLEARQATCGRPETVVC